MTMDWEMAVMLVAVGVLIGAAGMTAGFVWADWRNRKLTRMEMEGDD
jgi:uncharacterized membrane-anchored protein YhcB (DUF1043 family)